MWRIEYDIKVILIIILIIFLLFFLLFLLFYSSINNSSNSEDSNLIKIWEDRLQSLEKENDLLIISLQKERKASKILREQLEVALLENTINSNQSNQANLESNAISNPQARPFSAPKEPIKETPKESVKEVTKEVIFSTKDTSSLSEAKSLISQLKDELSRKNRLLQSLKEAKATYANSLEQWKGESQKSADTVKRLQRTLASKENMIQDLKNKLDIMDETLNNQSSPSGDYFLNFFLLFFSLFNKFLF